MKKNGCLLAILFIAALGVAFFLHLKNSKTLQDKSERVSGARIPARTLEKMVSPMIDSFIKKGTNEIAKDSINGSKILVPKTTVYGLKILRCEKTADGVRCDFESTSRFKGYGILKGSFNIKGSPLKWGNKDGFWAKISGKASLGDEPDSLSSKNIKEIALQIRDMLPGGAAIAVPEEKCIKRVLGFTSGGDVFIIESEEFLSLEQMSVSLMDADASYAIFLPGHLAYNCVIGGSGFGANFESYTKERPEGLSADLW